MAQESFHVSYVLFERLKISSCVSVFTHSYHLRTLTNITHSQSKELEHFKTRTSRSNTGTSHVLIPLGDDFRYTSTSECKKQFENFEKIFDFFERERSKYNVVASFSTLGEYFDAVREETSHQNHPFQIVQGDFFTYADKQDEFWSGYYVSRSFYKYQCRTLFSRLRAAEILLNFAHASSTRKGDYTSMYGGISFFFFFHFYYLSGFARVTYTHLSLSLSLSLSIVSPHTQL